MGYARKPNIIHPAACNLAALLLVAAILLPACGKENKGPSNVQKWIESGAKIVDVRTPGEFSSGAYPGAVNVPLNKIEDGIGAVAETTDNVVLYCASGIRSGRAMNILKKLGYTKVINAGGLRDMPR